MLPCARRSRESKSVSNVDRVLTASRYLHAYSAFQSKMCSQHISIMDFDMTTITRLDVNARLYCYKTNVCFAT
eukprot:6201505-Pleurochrysis_carterae.AAC.1